MLNLLFSPLGGIHRLQFLLGLCASLIMMFSAVGLVFLPTYLFTNPALIGMAPVLTIIVYLIAAVLSLASCWCSICVHLKRLYDLGVTRWLILIPFVGGLSEKFIKFTPFIIAIQIIILLYICALLFWPSRRG